MNLSKLKYFVGHLSKVFLQLQNLLMQAPTRIA